MWCNSRTTNIIFEWTDQTDSLFNESFSFLLILYYSIIICFLYTTSHIGRYVFLSKSISVVASSIYWSWWCVAVVVVCLIITFFGESNCISHFIPFYLCEPNPIYFLLSRNPITISPGLLSPPDSILITTFSVLHNNASLRQAHIQSCHVLLWLVLLESSAAIQSTSQPHPISYFYFVVCVRWKWECV